MRTPGARINPAPGHKRAFGAARPTRIMVRQ
jgi:hypothetical protein